MGSTSMKMMERNRNKRALIRSQAMLVYTSLMTVMPNRSLFSKKLSSGQVIMKITLYMKNKMQYPENIDLANLECGQYGSDISSRGSFTPSNSKVRSRYEFLWFRVVGFNYAIPVFQLFKTVPIHFITNLFLTSRLNFARVPQQYTNLYISKRMNKKITFNPLKLKDTPPLKEQQTKVTVGELRKIRPEDLFPCFSCFDEPALRGNCLACNKLGYIKGDHPMVKFADDFLTKNLMSYIKEIDDPDNEGKSQISQYSGQPQKKTFLNLTLTRKQCRSALESYTSKQPEGQIHSKLMKSSNPTTIEQIHYNYACNYCQRSPIKGARYHCQQCQDFDLCETCYFTTRNQKLPIEDHNYDHKVTKISKKIKPQEVIENLIKCEKPGTRNKGQK